MIKPRDLMRFLRTNRPASLVPGTERWQSRNQGMGSPSKAQFVAECRLSPLFALSPVLPHLLAAEGHFERSRNFFRLTTVVRIWATNIVTDPRLWQMSTVAGSTLSAIQTAWRNT